mgnify:CR=1 FL=1
MSETTTFTVRLPEPDKEALDEIVKKTGLKRADIIRLLIRQAHENETLTAPRLIGTSGVPQNLRSFSR